MISNFAYVRAGSIPEAIENLTSDKAHIHAGGTDLLACLRDDVFEAETVVSISKLSKLRGIQERQGQGLRIGALTTITDVAESPVVKKLYPGLAQAASEVASPQLRNQGTIGGNLCQRPRCWYYRGEFHCMRKGGDRCFAFEGENHFHCIFGSGGICAIVHPSDTAPMLTAIGAKVNVIGPNGSRLVPLEEFFVLPKDDVTKETILEHNEVVTEILLPAPPEGLKTSYRKVRARRSWDFALAGTALAIAFDGDTVKSAKVVLSGAAPIPWRSERTENAIVGRKLDEQTIAVAANAAVKDAEPLSDNAYKIPLFKGTIEEELTAIAAG